MKTAVDYFQQAVAARPSVCAAYAGLASTYDLLGPMKCFRRDKPYPLAIEFAAKALELDDTLSEAYSARATAA